VLGGIIVRRGVVERIVVPGESPRSTPVSALSRTRVSTTVESSESSMEIPYLSLVSTVLSAIVMFGESSTSIPSAPLSTTVTVLISKPLTSVEELAVDTIPSSHPVTVRLRTVTFVWEVEEPSTRIASLESVRLTPSIAWPLPFSVTSEALIRIQVSAVGSVMSPVTS